jgi:hypothetical protein
MDDAAGERENVLRLPEQRVSGRVHTVKRQARLVSAEPEWRVGAEHMNVVTARRERLRQLGGDNATASD